MMAQQQGFDLGSAYGKIVIDGSGIDGDIQAAKSGLSAGLDSLSSGLTNVGASLTGLAAPVAAAFGAGVLASNAFSQSVTNTGAVLGLTQDEIAALRSELLTIGGDTVAGPQAVADAYYDIAGGVADASTHMAILDAAIATSEAGNASLTGTTSALIAVMNSYGFAAEDATEVSDIMTRTVGMGVLTMDELASAMPSVTGVANSMGVKFDELSAVMAYFTTQGTSSAESATQIGSMLTALIDPSDEMRQALAEIGFTSGEAAIEQLGLAQTMQNLAGSSVVAENGIMSILGRVEALRGVTALTGGDFSSFIDTFKNGITDATSAARAIQLTDPAQQFALLQSSMSEMAITTGQALVPALITLVGQVRPVISSITGWIRSNPKLVSQIGMVAGALAVVGPALIVVGQSMGAIGTIIGAITSPIGLAVAAVTGLFWAFENNFLGIRDAVQPVIDTITEGLAFAQQAFGWFVEDIQEVGIIGAIRQAFGLDGGESWVEGVIATFLGASGQSTGAMRELAINITDALGGVVDFVLTTVIPGLQSLAGWFISDGLPAAVGFVQTVVMPAIQGFFNFLGNAWAVIQPHLSNLVNWFISDGLPGIVSFVQDTALPAIQDFFNFIGQVWATIQPSLNDLYLWFTESALPAVSTFINDTAIPAIQDFVDILEGIWIVVQPALTDMYNWFVTTGLPSIRAAISTVKLLYIDPFIAALQNIWTSISPGLTDVVNWFRDTFQHIGTNYIQPVITAVGDIITKVQSALDWLRQLGGGAPNTNLIDQNSQQLGFNTIPMRDGGGPGLAGMPYLIGPPQQGNELFIPSSNGTFVPDFAALLEQIAGQGGGGGSMVETVNVYANDAAGGRAAGDAFMQRITELYSARGLG
jgi:TP901 family phage tail tape measure protein